MGNQPAATSPPEAGGRVARVKLSELRADSIHVGLAEVDPVPSRSA
jgi:hypothetical protein